MYDHIIALVGLEKQDIPATNNADINWPMLNSLTERNVSSDGQ